MTNESSPKIKLSAAILAGGKAQRFYGMNKGEIRDPDGIPIIKKILTELHRAHINDLIIVSNLPALYLKYHQQVEPDLRKNIGPIGGIETALTYFKNKTDATLFLPCDMPNISAIEINALKEKFLTMPETPVLYAQSELNSNHPLFSVVRNDVLPQLIRLIDKGERKVSSAWKKMGGKPLRFNHSQAFININTPSDLNEWIK